MWSLIDIAANLLIYNASLYGVVFYTSDPLTLNFVCIHWKIKSKYMYKVIKKEQFSDRVFCMEVEAPLIAKSCKPGNFVIVRVDKVSERVP